MKYSLVFIFLILPYAFCSLKDDEKEYEDYMENGGIQAFPESSRVKRRKPIKKKSTKLSMNCECGLGHKGEYAKKKTNVFGFRSLNMTNHKPFEPKGMFSNTCGKILQSARMNRWR